MVEEKIALNATTDSFRAFYAERFPPLSRLAFLLTGSPDAADEIAQEACEQVLRRWNDIDHPHADARIAAINGARSWGVVARCEHPRHSSGRGRRAGCGR